MIKAAYRLLFFTSRLRCYTQFVRQQGTIVFIPTTREELVHLGWEQPDVILVSGDSYIDTPYSCLLYTSDAADDLHCVDLGGRRSMKKKKKNTTPPSHINAIPSNTLHH
mgnify:CR=1 FL=1